MSGDRFDGIRERERKEIAKTRALLAMGDMDGFKRHALRHPIKWSGPCPTEAEALLKLGKLSRQPRGTGEMFFVEEHPDGWHVMGRRTDTEPLPDWREMLGITLGPDGVK